MEWTAFIKYTAIGYLLYYGVLVILDLLRPEKGAVTVDEEDVLEFTEETGTVIIEDDDSPGSASEKNPVIEREGNSGEWPGKEETGGQWKLYGENVNVSTGGVSNLVDLFRLAHDETIEVKKSLVY